MKVVVTGSLGYDYIMDFPGRFADRIMPDKIHKISLSPIVDTFTKQFGGTAANFAYTLKLLGVEPLILSTGGHDFSPYKKFLNKHHVSTKYIKVVNDRPTGSYFVVTDKDDNQVGAFALGAMKYNDRLTLSQIQDPIDFVQIAPNKPTAMKQLVKECIAKHLSFMYDPAFQVAEFAADELREGISGATILIGNDYEISLIEQRLEISHEELLVMGPIVITTLGSQGSIIETRKENIHIKPAKPIRVVDPTGAGDAYRAGFVGGYLRQHDLVTCGRMGSVAAAYTVEKYGTVTHAFIKQEFKKRFKDNYGLSLAL